MGALSPGGPCFVGVDVGGTTIKAALFDDTALFDGAARPVVEVREPTPADAGPDAVVAALLAVTRQVVELAQARLARPAAIGVAALGLVDEAAGLAVRSARIGWRDVPLRAIVERELAIPVALGHDLRAAALAEARLGAGRGSASFAFLAVGTGVGGAVVLDGVPLTGAHARAAEIGHLRVAGADLACPCGSVGCLETVASARGIALAYRARTGRTVTAADVAGRLADDADAAAVWARAVDALAEALAICQLVVDPAAVVIGGGLSLAGDLLLRPLRGALADRVTLGPAPPLVRSALGDRSALVGAGLLAARLLGG
ncbi:ROK family protein [Pseudofrankia inefficax]|uniref:ROK family protein n=1 Tax=Pseudofrankia inefficax (strain DSM 45817 / CECT 9037 / DDB 130130 / EuI1c) TaxID=298654 RepID=E3J3Y6_PSEI1|nr:ROK family protein [Pseudofrankia inefficax]ADP80619.1 ROK family protein [Pseudofrankia inefficax]